MEFKVRIILFLFFVLSALPIPAQDVYVDRLYIQSDYNAGYILSHASRIIPTGQKVSSGVIDCAVNELKKSGMFKRIEKSFVPISKGKYYLYLKPIYKGNPAQFLIKEISIEGFVMIDRKTFVKRLDEQNVRVGVSFMPFSDIGRAIAGVVNSFDPNDEKTLDKNLWIDATLISPNSIRLVVKEGIPCQQ